jgi:hypothetical protein
VPHGLPSASACALWLPRRASMHRPSLSLPVKSTPITLASCTHIRYFCLCSLFKLRCYASGM